MSYDEGCFSCGATQVDLRPAEVASFPPRHVRLCEECARDYRAAGLLAVEPVDPPSDFALKLAAAITPQITEPGSPSTG